MQATGRRKCKCKCKRHCHCAATPQSCNDQPSRSINRTPITAHGGLPIRHSLHIKNNSGEIEKTY